MTPRGFGTTSTDGDPGRFETRRARMVERQLSRRGIRDPRVLDAMGRVPREEFVPSELRDDAYRDGALRIGEGQTISQPWIVASMAELLELRGDELVLEVGTGSGYAAAVLALLAREVVSVERHASLAQEARARLAELGYETVQVRHGDGSLGARDRAPFGGISVTATATERPPEALFDQLAPGAALVCPVERRRRERLVRFRDGTEEAVAAVRFVPLIEDQA